MGRCTLVFILRCVRVGLLHEQFWAVFLWRKRSFLLEPQPGKRPVLFHTLGRLSTLRAS